ASRRRRPARRRVGRLAFPLHDRARHGGPQWLLMGWPARARAKSTQLGRVIGDGRWAARTQCAGAPPEHWILARQKRLRGLRASQHRVVLLAYASVRDSSSGDRPRHAHTSPPTNMTDAIYLLVWFYNQRAGAENLVKEANNDAGLAAHPSARWMMNCNHF